LPGKEFHVVYEYSSTAAGLFQIIRDVQTPSGGTSETPTNHNENSENTSSSSLTLSGSDAGTPITYTGGQIRWQETFGSGQQSGGNKNRANERIIKAGVSTVFRLESQVATNKLWLAITWYEHQAE